MDESTEWEISTREFSHYFAFFQHLSPSGESLAGTKGRDFFLRSSLPRPTLSKIWQLADVDRDGKLNAAEFAIAMNFVQHALKGTSPPLTLPSSLLTCVHHVMHPQLPVIEDKHVTKCQTAFTAFKADLVQGVLGMEAAKYLFTKSNLSQGQLYHIWKLSDGDRDGHLTFQEFTVAMHLIFLAKLGYLLPVELDPASILPPLFYKVVKDAQAKSSTSTPTPRPLTSSLFPPPESPFENSDLGMVFSSDCLGSAAAQAAGGDKHQDMSSHELDPFLTPVPVNGEASHTGTRGFVRETAHVDTQENDEVDITRSKSENVVMATGQVHEEVVMERNEPVLQRAKVTAVEVVSPQVEALMMPQVVMAATEETDTGEGGGGRGEGEGESEGEEEWEDGVVEEQLVEENGEEEEEEEEREKEEEDEDSTDGEEWMQEKVHAELESLSQASRQFLKESRSKLQEQQFRNLTPSYPNTFGMEQYRHASTKGLSATIAEIEGEEGGGGGGGGGGGMGGGMDMCDHEEQLEYEPSADTEEGGGQASGDLLAHFDDLEAEIMSALEDTQLRQDEEEGEERDEERGTLGMAGSSHSGSGTDLIHSLREVGGTSSSYAPVIASASRLKEEKAASSYPPPPPARDLADLSPPLRQKGWKRESSEENVMEDLDSYLQSEIDSINDMFEEFQTHDKEQEERKKRESEELKTLEGKVSQMEEVTERRMKESEEIERRYQLEMKRLEEERLRALEEAEAVKEMTLESDTAIQNLSKEWESLLAEEEQMVKETQKEKERREQREKEEQERRERERRERASEQEMTVEEWIQWMEEKKKQGMTPEQQVEYERRKKLWLEKEREREEKRKKEEMEKIQRTREKMEVEYRQFKMREKDVMEHRLSAAELQKLQEEAAKKGVEERKARGEKTRKKFEESRTKEMEQLKPKAKSALAAKWEEQVRSRQAGTKGSQSSVQNGKP